MKVLVTGHKGYIGSVMVPMLLDAGHEVVGMDSDLYRRSTYKSGMRPVPVLLKDIRDAELSDFAGIDAVIHLAALSNDPLGDFNPDLTYSLNHRASVHLAALARRAGVKRFILSSSCSTYGAAGDDYIDESAEFHPVTPYGISKVNAELDIAGLANDEFSPVFMRSATAYGVSPRLRFDLVLNNLVAWAFTTGRILIKSDGTPWRPLVHIEDISRAFLAALTAPRNLVHTRAFNVGRTSENYRVRELAEIVGETVPGCKVEFASDAGPDKRNYRVNCDKIASSLPGFKPEWDVRRGAASLYAAYKETGLKLEDFEGPRFKRIDHIKLLIGSGALTDRLRWTAAQPHGEQEVANVA